MNSRWFLALSFLCLWLGHARSIAAAPFEAGEGVVDISPPVGTALGGYRYRDPAKPRVSTGISTPPEARALVVRLGSDSAAIVSLDMLNISFAMTRRVQAAVEARLGIPASHVHISATHSHSMPSIAFNRHWGDQNPAYEATVEAAMLTAVAKAHASLAPAKLRVGTAAVVGGNHNRTAAIAQVKTDAEFNADATDADRWLDTRLKLLVFERTNRPSLLWYNFSAHSTASGASAGLAGADWPGFVQKIVREEKQLSPAFLQGHIGDVAPGNTASGTVARTPYRTAIAVADAIYQALATAQAVDVSVLRAETQVVELPLDLAAFQTQIAAKKPLAEAGKLDAFEKDWYDTFATKYDLNKTTLPITLGAIRLGDVAFLFHPAELYSYYGLAIQRGSPLKHTLVVGYADGYVGYVTDPKAYQQGEYAAKMVPTILNYPPFTPTAGRELAAAATELLRKVGR